MVSFKLAGSVLLSLLALGSYAQDADIVEEVEDPSSSPNLAVTVSASFPNSEIFGVKLVNGHATQAVLDVQNGEDTPINVAFVGGSLWAPSEPPMIMRNLTTQRYNVEIPAGERQSLIYSFATELHPQDLTLNLVTVVTSNEAFYTIQSYNETVSIVEAPTSIFDPQIIFLYIVLLSAFAGTCYFIYNTWITTLFPQKKGRGKGGERAKASSKGSVKAVAPADQVSVVGADGPAVTTSSKAYDESWIPASHLQRPEAKRVRSGTPKTKPARA